MEGKIGVVAPGAFADLLVVDGNPLDDIGILADPAAHLQQVMKAGQIHLDRR
jgi:imidazolonepropionase-like amidohydrolase